jgi:AAA ATPase domain
VRPQLAVLIPALSNGASAITDAAVERARLFAAIRDLLGALAAERRTVLVVVEDLHWADPGTLDLLNFLLRGLPAGTAMVRDAMLLAFIPGIFAAVAITLAAREAKRSVGSAAGRRTLSFNLRELRQAGLARTLAPAALFELGNVATTLLILPATGLLHADGRSFTAATSVAILMYAAHNGAATLAAAGGGHLIDRVNARIVFALAAAVYVAAHVLFALDQHRWPVLLLAFVLAGVGHRVRRNRTDHDGRARAAGPPARQWVRRPRPAAVPRRPGCTLAMAWLWAAFSPTVAFGYVATWMSASLITTLALAKRPRTTPTRP